MTTYIHGYSAQEAERLDDQGSILAPLLHHDTVFPVGSRVLEIGCGTGAASAALLTRSPSIRLTAIDISPENLARARERLDRLGLAAELVQTDVYAPRLPEPEFDHVFGCFVLEHLADPGAALAAIRRLVRPGGTVMFIEGDHRSARVHPETPAIKAVCRAFEAAQRAAGGDPTLGLRLHGLLERAGFEDVRVSPRLVYADASEPDYRAGFVRRIFTPMMAGAREAAVSAGVEVELFEQGVDDLLAADRDPNGVVCYTFFKAFARTR